jgi:COMPASS component SWD2
MADTPQQSTPQLTQKVSDVIRNYRPTKVGLQRSNPLLFAPDMVGWQAFRFPKQDVPVHITSLDFDDQGDYLVAAGDDETVQVFDIKEGKSTKTVPSKKYGVHLARFTHHSRQILHASTKVDGMYMHVLGI